jgi:ABC-type phosphate/phosphonate transport system substrate-binding protein
MKFLLSFIGAAAIVASSGRAQNAPDPVQIGLAESLFEGTAEKTVTEMSKSFNDLVKELTGMNGKAHTKGDAFAVAKKLEDKTLHLGVFQGYEYAWVKQKYPDFKPLMVAIYFEPTLKAQVVVNKDSAVTDLAGLKGKDFALAEGTKGYCKLFIERQIAKLGADPKSFFKKITQPSGSEEALDDVAGKEVFATVVDSVSLKTYERIKPGVFKRLKVLKNSETFPTNVVVYREGVLSKETLEKFRQGMLKAHTTETGKQQMRVFKVTGFENVPDDYANTVAAILKAYPPPETNKK